MGWIGTNLQNRCNYLYPLIDMPTMTTQNELQFYRLLGHFPVTKKISM